MKMDIITKEYEKLFPAGTKYEDITKVIDSMGKTKKADDLREILCDELIRSLSEGGRTYPSKMYLEKNPFYHMFMYNVRKLPENKAFPRMIYSVFTGDEKSLEKYFEAFTAPFFESKDEINEGALADFFIVPLKNALPGFWKKAQNRLSPFCKRPQIVAEVSECIYKTRQKTRKTLQFAGFYNCQNNRRMV